VMNDSEGRARFSYRVAVKGNLIAQHYLIGEAPESEKQPHSHRYAVEVQLEGFALNDQGYLVDIDDVERHLNELLGAYRDKTLNDLPEFRDVNPSIEHLARVLCTALLGRLTAPNIEALAIRVWESAHVWALCRQDLSCGSV
jgi:6-pyruvoyltetrahydropterin/6-carboxytetrahydropterin synthase